MIPLPRPLNVILLKAQRRMVSSLGQPIRIYAEKGVKLKYLGNMTFSNFRIKSKQPILLQGNPETMIEKIRFSEITLETPGGQAIRSEYVRKLELNQIELFSEGKEK